MPRYLDLGATPGGNNCRQGPMLVRMATYYFVLSSPNLRINTFNAALQADGTNDSQFPR
jgi:hypothetical protein